MNPAFLRGIPPGTVPIYNLYPDPCPVCDHYFLLPVREGGRAFCSGECRNAHTSAVQAEPPATSSMELEPPHSIEEPVAEPIHTTG